MTTNRFLLRSLSIISIVILVSTSMYAGDGGSIYSLLGIGDLTGTLSVRSLGMGSTGVAISSSSALNMMAPATWAGLSRTRLEAAAMYQGFSSNDGLTSRFIADLNLLNAQVGFPIAPSKGISLVAGFSRYSDVSYDTYSSGTGYTGPDTIPYSIHYQGTGGIGLGQLGLSYAPLAWCSVGASFDYYFGSVENIRTLTSSSSSYLGSRFDRITSYHGPGGTFGVLFNSLGWIAGGLKPLAIGASFSTRNNVTSSAQSILTFGSDPVTTPTEADTTADLSGAIVIPITYTVGASYAAGSRYLVAADFTAQLWKESSFNGAPPSDLGNATRFGFGIEREPSRETNPTWAERVALRIGGSFGTLYYHPKNTAINQWLVTAGASLPLSSSSRMHLALEYGERGTLTNGLTKDHVFRLTAAISVGEEWFVQLPEDW